MGFRNPLTIDATARAAAQAAQNTANTAYSNAAQALTIAGGKTRMTVGGAAAPTGAGTGDQWLEQTATGWRLRTYDSATGAWTVQQWGAEALAVGAVTAGTIAAGAINGQTITGALVQTAATGQRVALNSPGIPNAVAFYSGDAAEVFPGTAQVVKDTGATRALDSARTTLSAPDLYVGNHYDPMVQVTGSTRDGSAEGFVIVQAGGPPGATLPPRLVVGPTVHTFSGAPVTFGAGLTQVAAGSVSITPTAANTPTSKAISFGKTFTVAPVVVTTAQTSSPGVTVPGTSANQITTTGCNVYLDRADTTATTVSWVAFAAGI